jgi:hypothetical protein
MPTWLPDEKRLEWGLIPSELEQLKLVSLGCHRSCDEAIAAIFRELEIVSWSLNDYFLVRPLRLQDAKDRTIAPAPENKSREGDLSWRSGPLLELYYPFFERRMRSLPFLADVDPEDRDPHAALEHYTGLLKDPEQAIEHVLDWPIRPNTEEAAAKIRRGFDVFLSTLSQGTNGMALIRNWAHGHRPLAMDEPERLEPFKRRVQYCVDKQYSVWDFVQLLLDDWRSSVKQECDNPDMGPEELAILRNDRAAARVEHALNDHFWLLGAKHPRQPPPAAGKVHKTKPVKTSRKDLPVTSVIAVSIASEHHFYGYLVVEYPVLNVNPSRLKALREKRKGELTAAERRELGAAEKAEALPRRLERALGLSASRDYLDVLVLFFNRVYETRLLEKLEKIGKSDGALAALVKKECRFEELADDPETEAPSAASGKQAAPPTNGAPTGVAQPLFHVEDWVRWLWRERYRWCLARPGEPYRKEVAEGLRRSLVLAKMQIASPPMVGVIRRLMNFGIQFRSDVTGLPAVLVIGGPGSGKDNTARLVAMFAKGYTFGHVQTINMAAMRPQFLVGPMLQGAEVAGLPHEPVLPIVEEEHTEGVTVILDELNSLDIDQQGILLRILENSEVTPLFSRKSRRANFLCVGVMNEQPQDLMKEDELRLTATHSHVFGNILGTFIDEMFRRARRLRPDLFYRMQRFGVVLLPNLLDRRADIPILFRSFLPPKERDAPGRRYEYDIELAAYERLMEKDLPWPGNIRELQAVTKRVFLAVQPEAQYGQKTVRFKISRVTVDRVLLQQQDVMRAVPPSGP